MPKNTQKTIQKWHRIHEKSTQKMPPPSARGRVPCFGDGKTPLIDENWKQCRAKDRAKRTKKMPENIDRKNCQKMTKKSWKKPHKKSIKRSKTTYKAWHKNAREVPRKNDHRKKATNFIENLTQKMPKNTQKRYKNDTEFMKNQHRKCQKKTPKKHPKKLEKGRLPSGKARYQGGPWTCTCAG